MPLLDLNRARVDAALMLLRRGLAPFVETEFRARYQELGLKHAQRFMGERAPTDPLTEWDVADLLKLMWSSWNDVFIRKLSPTDRSKIRELQDIRVRWAHQKPLPKEDVDLAIVFAKRLLAAVKAPEVGDLEKLRECGWDALIGSDARSVDTPTRKAPATQRLDGSTDVHFVYACRWNLWREVVVDNKGQPQGHAWAIALRRPEPILDQVGGPNPGEEILCEVLRRPDSLKTPILIALAIAAATIWALIMASTVAEPGFRGFMGGLAKVMIVTMGTGTAFSFLDIARRRDMARRCASQWYPDDWRMIKEQVRDLLYAAQTAERACPQSILDKMAREAPTHLLERADEIVDIYRHSNNPIGAPQRRQLLAEFVLETMSGEFDISSNTHGGERLEARRERLLVLLTSYWQKDYEALQLARRELASPSGIPAVGSAVRGTPPLEHDLELMASEALISQRKAFDLGFDLRAALEKDMEKQRAAGMPEEELQSRRTLASAHADALLRDFVLKSTEVKRERRVKEKTPGSDERGPNL